MKQAKTVVAALSADELSFRKEWQAFVTASTTAAKKQTGIYAHCESILRASTIKEDDAKGRSALNAKLRDIAGIKTEKRATVDGKQAAKNPSWNAFDSMLSTCWKKVYPKPASKKWAGKKEGDKKEAGKKESGVAKGLTTRVACYALVLQDLAAAKTHAALSASEVKQAEKLIIKLKALAELGYPD